LSSLGIHVNESGYIMLGRVIMGGKMQEIKRR
jgi:hypothetical protein